MGLSGDLIARPFRPGYAQVMVPAGCGELVQGTLDGEPALVTCPIDWYSQVSLQLLPGSDRSAPAGLTKTAAALRAGRRFLMLDGIGLRVSVQSTIPLGRGYASSTADIGASLYALGESCGVRLCASDVAQLAVTIEPTDSTIFGGLAIFAHRTGAYHETIGMPPAISVLAFDTGEVVDTLDYNRVDRSEPLRALAPVHRDAFEMLTCGVAHGDLGAIGAAATLSARLHQRLLYNPLLEHVMKLATNVHGLGVCRAHSGSVLGLLLDSGRADVLDIAQYCRQNLGQCCQIAVHKMVSGGPTYCRKVSDENGSIIKAD